MLKAESSAHCRYHCSRGSSSVYMYEADMHVSRRQKIINSQVGGIHYQSVKDHTLPQKQLLHRLPFSL